MNRKLRESPAIGSPIRTEPNQQVTVQLTKNMVRVPGPSYLVKDYGVER